VKPAHWGVIIAGALLGVWLFNSMLHPTGYMTQPQAQPHPDDDVARWTDSGAPGCHPEQHHAGYVYTPHRYPRAVGGEITALVHNGYSSMRVPGANPDVQWIIAPPSEVMW